MRMRSFGTRRCGEGIGVDRLAGTLEAGAEHRLHRALAGWLPGDGFAGGISHAVAEPFEARHIRSRVRSMCLGVRRTNPWEDGFGEGLLTPPHPLSAAAGPPPRSTRRASRPGSYGLRRGSQEMAGSGPMKTMPHDL